MRCLDEKGGRETGVGGGVEKEGWWRGVLSILSVTVHIDEHASTEIHVSRFGVALRR